MNILKRWYLAYKVYRGDPAALALYTVLKLKASRDNTEPKETRSKEGHDVR